MWLQGVATCSDTSWNASLAGRLVLVLADWNVDVGSGHQNRHASTALLNH